MPTRLEQLLKLHAADPADPFCTYGIALEHGKAGAFDQALTWLDKTLELDGNYAYAFFQKAKMFIEKGEEEQAKATLQNGIAAARKHGSPDSLHAAEEMTGLLESI
ncbi:MAG: tetratricopeptide repeat protein [Planctomycetota bacterium]|nr:tetratricopeptide repeat protein [Planctomycetota bacterium]